MPLLICQNVDTAEDVKQSIHYLSLQVIILKEAFKYNAHIHEKGCGIKLNVKHDPSEDKPAVLLVHRNCKYRIKYFKHNEFYFSH